MNKASFELRNKILYNLVDSMPGITQSKCGKILGLSQKTISYILSKRNHSEVPCKKVGRVPLLSEEKISELPKFLLQGSLHYGFEGDYWTQERVKYVIAQEFGVCFSTKQVGRILKKICWTLQKPQKKTFNKIQKK
jgi:transposase